MTFQGVLTAISGGFTAFYFAGYSTSHPDRKVAILTVDGNSHPRREYEATATTSPHILLANPVNREYSVGE